MTLHIKFGSRSKNKSKQSYKGININNHRDKYKLTEMKLSVSL